MTMSFYIYHCSTASDKSMKIEVRRKLDLEVRLISDLEVLSVFISEGAPIFDVHNSHFGAA